jgi:hypothetical protein
LPFPDWAIHRSDLLETLAATGQHSPRRSTCFDPTKDAYALDLWGPGDIGNNIVCDRILLFSKLRDQSSVASASLPESLNWNTSCEYFPGIKWSDVMLIRDVSHSFIMASPVTTSHVLRYSAEELVSLRDSLPVVTCVVEKLNKHPDIGKYSL